MRITGHGISIDLPTGWEGRIRRADPGGPVLHVASFALDEGDGAFGAAATGRMRDGDGFAALVEYCDAERVPPGVGLFAPARPRPLHPRDFAAMQLQVTRPGQLGCQRFFTDAGRTLCLYAVIQPSWAGLEPIVDELARVLASLRVTPARERVEPSGSREQSQPG